MIEGIVRAILTFNATSLLVVIYQIKSPILLPHFEGCARYLLNIGLLAVPVLLTSLTIPLSRKLGKEEIKKDSIASIEYANNAFLPSYLGYFFVALSIPNTETLIFVYAVLFVFTFFSQALYFNPLFLLFGYKFYNATTKQGTVVFLISRQEFRIPSHVTVARARRINDYTFLEE